MESLDADYSHADSGNRANNFSDGGMYQRPMSMDDQYLLTTSREYDDSETNDDRHSPDSSYSSRAKGSIISKMVRRSMDDSNVSDLRMSRLAQAEAAMRQEIFKECTFRPQIKDLPASYGSRKKDVDIPFTARVAKWKNERDLEIKAKSTLITQGRLAECTFHPKINDNSEKAVKVLRGPESVDRLKDRLYKSSEVLKQQRDQLVQQKSAKEDMDIQQECTFKPDLKATKHAAVHQQSSSKFSIIIDKPSEMPYELRDCTFTPKINKIKPNMSSAKLYISTDVVDRLTRPIASSSSSAEDSSQQQQQQRFDSTSPSGRSSRPGVMNIQSFLGSLQGSAAKAVAQQSPQLSSDEKLKRQLKFESFLNRQKAIMKRKEEQIQQIQRATTPKFRPTITKRAQQEGGGGGGTADGSSSSSFMKRNEADIQKRIAKEQQQEVVSQLDENCTFRPHIQSSRRGSSSSSSGGQRSRSSFELSHGDALRKETNRRMLKLKNDQQELQHMTFQPKISDYAKEVSGRLQINNEQGTQFLECLKQENIKKEAKRLEILRLREEQEAKSCTFSPQTTDCPAYIKRIAKSMSIVKAARNSTSGLLDNSNTKPDWK